MRNLANNIPTRDILLLDALRYSLELERKEYLLLKSSLKRIEKTVSKDHKPSVSSTLKALTSAWEIVDVVFRSYGLVAQIPIFSRSPEVRLFRQAIQSIKDFRNLYQHLNSEIPRINGPTNPIMGVLSWVINSQDSLTVFLGSDSPAIHAHTVAIDTHNGCFAQTLLFSAGNKDIELDKVHAECRTIAKFLESWLKANNKLSGENAESGLIKFGIRFKN